MWHVDNIASTAGISTIFLFSMFIFLPFLPYPVGMQEIKSPPAHTYSPYHAVYKLAPSSCVQSSSSYEKSFSCNVYLPTLGRRFLFFSFSFFFFFFDMSVSDQAEQNISDVLKDSVYYCYYYYFYYYCLLPFHYVACYWSSFVIFWGGILSFFFVCCLLA